MTDIMKAVEMLVAEVLNRNSKFEQEITETINEVGGEVVDIIANIEYLDGTYPETEQELKADLANAINSLPTKQRFKLDELMGAIAYARS